MVSETIIAAIIGGSISLIIGIFGLYQWYQNFQYKKEKDEQQERQSKLEGDRDEKGIYIKELNSFLDRYEQQIKDMRKDFDKKFGDQEKEIASLNKKYDELLKKHNSEKNYYEAEIERLEMEGDAKDEVISQLTTENEILKIEKRQLEEERNK